MRRKQYIIWTPSTPRKAPTTSGGLSIFGRVPFSAVPAGRYWTEEMSINARPLRRTDVEAIFDKKLADFHHKARSLVLRHVNFDVYSDAASDDPDIGLELQMGLIESVRDPVLVRLEDHELFTCPVLALKILTDEPPELHRAFVEGAFLRKLFRFFVPATHEGGESWEVTQQVRDIMQKHFAFQLVACETVLGKAS